LRLVWPRWQCAGTASVRSVAAEFPLDVARRGYAVGSGGASVSVARFSELAARYGDDLAILWIDSHPAIRTSASR
jgi:arginase family enzyme